MKLRIFSLSLSLLTLVGCGDDDAGADGSVADSAPDGTTGEVTELVVDTYNIALAGAFVPNEAARRAPVIAEVAALTSDIVCLQEVWEQSDKDAIIAAAATNFPHVLSHTTDFNTPIASAEDETGTVPPPFTTAPCADFMTELNAAVDCLSANCSTMPGSEDGQTTSSACAAENCVPAVSALLFGGPEQLRCYSCLTTQLPTEPFTDMRDLCTTEVGATVAFRGQSSTMILSKHPLSEPTNFVMPGTWNRRVVTVATATLPSGAEVDVYCNHLTPLFESITFPYTGQYGAGNTGGAAWAAEQLLQANKLIALVEERSAGRPAVILGDMNTGRGSLGEGLSDESPQTIDRFREAFTFGVAAGYAGQCTYCSDNANDAEDMLDVWIDHIFVFNLNAASVLSTERTFDQATVAIDGGGMVPPSDHYGLRSTLAIPVP